MSENTPATTQFTPQKLAELLSSAARRKITEQQVLQIAEKGKLVKPDGTINLIEYTTFLVSETSNVRD